MRSFLLAFAAAAIASAQNPVAWALAREGDGPVGPGKSITLVVTARIEKGWSLYSVTQPKGGPIPTRISLPAGQPFAQDGAIVSDPPSRKHDPNFDMEVEYHSGEASFRIPAKASATGDHKVRVEARYQSCTDQICLPPKTVVMEVAVPVKR